MTDHARHADLAVIGLGGTIAMKTAPGGAVPGLTAEDLGRESAALRARREQAGLRSARPWRQTASALVDERLPEPSEEAARPPAAAGEAAAAAGTGVHRVFEELDLAAPLGEALAAQRARLHHCSARGYEQGCTLFNARANMNGATLCPASAAMSTAVLRATSEAIHGATLRAACGRL